MPPKLLTCIRFLYKVVHKNGRLRKFNRSREIEFKVSSDTILGLGATLIFKLFKMKLFRASQHSVVHIEALLTSNQSPVQCIQKFFSQILFDFKRMVSYSISPKFSGKIPYVLSKPLICFWGPKIKQFCFKPL